MSDQLFVIPIKCPCGFMAEAHCEAVFGTHAGPNSGQCPECGREHRLPTRMIRPLVSRDEK